jgi:hypothetical protein
MKPERVHAVKYFASYTTACSTLYDMIVSHLETATLTSDTVLVIANAGRYHNAISNVVTHGFMYKSSLYVQASIMTTITNTISYIL